MRARRESNCWERGCVVIEVDCKGTVVSEQWSASHRKLETDHCSLTTVPLHSLQVPEAASAKHHHRKEQEVVRRVHHYAGSQRACTEPRPAKYKADTNQKKKWAQRITGLGSMHACERKAGENRSDGHGVQGPLWLAVLVERAHRCACGLFVYPIAGSA